MWDTQSSLLITPYGILISIESKAEESVSDREKLDVYSQKRTVIHKKVYTIFTPKIQF